MNNGWKFFKIVVGIFIIILILGYAYNAVSLAHNKIAKPHLSDVEESQVPKELKVYISLNMPRDSLAAISREVEKVGGKMVLRGLPNNSFSQLSSEIRTLRREGVKANIIIDPKAFQIHRIKEVPCFMLQDGDKVDYILGNISLSFALKLMHEKGEVYKFAGKLYERLGGAKLE